jgi:hypothetical protein
MRTGGLVTDWLALAVALAGCVGIGCGGAAISPAYRNWEASLRMLYPALPITVTVVRDSGDAAWDRAKRWVQQHADGPIALSTADFIASDLPSGDAPGSGSPAWAYEARRIERGDSVAFQVRTRPRGFVADPDVDRRFAHFIRTGDAGPPLLGP